MIDPSFCPPIVAPLPASERLDGITDHDARLIFDLVANLRPKSAVLVQYGMTVQDLASKAQSPMWQAAYRETERLWKSEMNTAQRIRLKAAFLLEDSLVPLSQIVHSQNMPVSSKLQAIEQLTKISTVANVPKDSATGERHSITINIGGGKAPIVISTEKPHGGTTIDA